MKKACKQCKILIEGGECPICKNSDFATSWNGRISVLDMEKSAIAKRLAVPQNGEYAIKVR